MNYSQLDIQKMMQAHKQQLRNSLEGEPTAGTLAAWRLEDAHELVAGAYIVRFTNVISNRFDSTTFKRLYADLYKDFTKPVSSRRFSVSC